MYARLASPETSRPALAGHIPALDGIRGLAILMVMIYHLTALPGAVGLERAWVSLAAFGWAGVDLFFVLSGFLITGILWEARGGQHYFRNFYARRTLRIFPLYYAVMTVLLVILPRLPHPQAARYGAVGGEQVWYWTYLSNFAIGLRHEWRLGSIDLSWSLAIEEQFYLLWPAIVLLLGRRALLRFCLALVVVAATTRTVLTLCGGHPIAINVLTPCRMDGLALGAFLAVAVRGPGGIAVLVPKARFCAVVSLLLLVPLFVVQGPKWGVVPGPGQMVGYTLLALFYACVLLLAVARPRAGLLNRVFSHGFLTTFGRYSYALYLFHLPLAVCLRETALGPNRFPPLLGSRLPGQFLFYLAGIGLSLAAAWISWRVYESPLLSLKRFFPAVRPPALVDPGLQTAEDKRNHLLRVRQSTLGQPFVRRPVAGEKDLPV